MSDDAVAGDALRVITCQTDETLAAASGLFDRYRHHYGEPPAGERTQSWLIDMVRSEMLTVYTASVAPGAPPIGLATSHAVPASLRMGLFWQLRDLYVVPELRHRGVATALVRAVCDAAVAAGAARVSLVTEPDNHGALDLYRGLGFTPLEGVVSLGLDLTPRSDDAED